MHKAIFRVHIWLLATLILGLDAHAQYTLQEGNEGQATGRTILLPYAFSTETLGFGVGMGGTFVPDDRPQTTYYGTGYMTDNASWLALVGGYNVQVQSFERFAFRPMLSMARQSQKRLYLDGNPDFTDERSGSNESSPENYLSRDAYEITADLPLRYTLPLGHFRHSAIHTYITRNGILKSNPSGAASWNPLESGQSSLFFRPFYRKTWDQSDEDETLFFELGIEHDNRDFIPNPHRGYRANASIRYDPEWLASAREWVTWEAALNTFIPLPKTSWIRQQTLALEGWASYSPTYNTGSETGNGKPPYFAGPNLGGMWRLRGYPRYRFHDKAAIHYTAEYRIMPEWQPFGDFEVLDPLMIRWWQIVARVEVGRVAPGWDPGTLHRDMKYDVGIGIRGMFNTGIGRLDFVASDEGVSFIAMFGQAF